MHKMRPNRFLASAAALVLVMVSACGHSRRYPAPMPPRSSSACDHPDAAAKSAEPSESADIVPIKRVAPKYPNRAVNRGIQGWVCLEFTITETGTVRDPHVINSAPGGYFEDAALQAIAQWLYDPKIVGGEAVEKPGVRLVLKFALSR